MSDRLIRELQRKIAEASVPNVYDVFALYNLLYRQAGAPELEKTAYLVVHDYDPDEIPGYSIHLTEEGLQVRLHELMVELINDEIEHEDEQSARGRTLIALRRLVNLANKKNNYTLLLRVWDKRQILRGDAISVEPIRLDT